jgi:hypothetical protein
MSAHRPVLIINAEIADPLTGRTERGSLAIEDGMIHDFGRAIDTPPEGALIIDTWNNNFMSFLCFVFYIDGHFLRSKFFLVLISPAIDCFLRCTSN